MLNLLIGLIILTYPAFAQTTSEEAVTVLLQNHPLARMK